MPTTPAHPKHPDPNRTVPTAATTAKRMRRWPLAAALVLVAALAAAATVTGCAGFGAHPEGERQARIAQSPQWDAAHGRFRNVQPIWIDLSVAFRSWLFGSASPDVQPRTPIQPVASDPARWARPPAAGLRITWFGHSSALVEVDGRTVLIDPFWGERSGPGAGLGPKRWFAPPATIAQLPPVDVVVVSHDHYDHLDLETVQALKPTRAVFVVPLGVGAHLERWGVPAARIVELDWWQRTRVGDLTIVSTPARHSSGRLKPSSDRTLWSGWALLGPQHRVWYSGDTGLHDDIARIGRDLGPFDLTLIEAGQYNADWADNHLGPEQAVAAHRMARGRWMVPVHWGLLQLAMHGWTEPPERVLAEAARLGFEADVLTPAPGQPLEPGVEPRPGRWWPQVAWQTAKEAPVVSTRDGHPDHRYPAP